MTHITTISGLHIDLLDPDPDNIIIEDIAFALSNICRFVGHTKYFYSVAEHSVMAAQYCSYDTENPEKVLNTLLHDATEAYLGDVSSPLKHILPDYQRIENNFHRILYTKFGLDPNDHSYKEYDSYMLDLERHILKNDILYNKISFHFQELKLYSPQESREQFLTMFYHLNDKRKDYDNAA